MIRFGDVTVLAAIEDDTVIDVHPTALFPAFDADALSEAQSWLEPSHMDPGTGRLLTRLQSVVVRTPDAVVVVDTGHGAGKHRPSIPEANELPDRLSGTLRGVGIEPDAVTAVVNTHAHFDHSGGNTLPGPDRWRPAFPNAEYYVAAAELEHWRDPVASRALRLQLVENVIAESYDPLRAAGLLHEVTPPVEIATGVTLQSASGHTPGSMFVRIAAGGVEAWVLGDAIHHAVQLAHPEWSPMVDEDQAASAAARRTLLDEAVAANAILIPAHFRQGGVRIRRSGEGYEPTAWFDLGPDAQIDL